MPGAPGVLCCMAVGMAVGSWMKEKRAARFQMLLAEMEAVSRMRLLLEEERPPLPQLLMEGARVLSDQEGARQTAMRLRQTAQLLERQPRQTVAEAYAAACKTTIVSWENEEEKAAMDMLFDQLGSGTAAMREQAASCCLRRLKPLIHSAQEEADRGGKLYLQLGTLLGLMLGIALW